MKATRPGLPRRLHYTTKRSHTMENGGAKAATLRLLRRMLPSFSSNDWFLRRRMAAQRVVDINNGLFYLLSRVYFGENTRHWILCTSCGNAFRHVLRALQTQL